jgi:DNA-directed RNA polymerase subunit E'/Rpb7
MTSPYFNTRLQTTVSLTAKQMNNEIDSHLKQNLIREFEGKCYKNYGCISKIYEINEKKGGRIEAENSVSSAYFDVIFSCRISIPLKNKFIICKVEQATQALTGAINGYIKVLLTNDRINADNFIVGKTGIFIKSKTGLKALTKGDHVKVKIESRKFNDKDTIIMCMGILHSMATEDEITKFQQDEYNYSEKFVDYDKYIQLEELNKNAELINDGKNVIEITDDE